MDHPDTPVLRLGTCTPSALYNGFCGAPQDACSRFLALTGEVAQAEGNAQYCADVSRDLLQRTCYARIGPPHSFEDLRARANLDWLRYAWQDDAEEMETIENFAVPEVGGLVRRLRPLIREFAPLVSPTGFALEDTRSAVFSIRARSASDSASRFPIMDLKDFAVPWSAPCSIYASVPPG